MNHQLYQTSQFARKASVSVRTLRYYDQMGLLTPSIRTAAGHRLYSEQDLFTLQQILALKFLGFSLAEIARCLECEPTSLQETLALQKAMLLERRLQLDAIVQAISETESLLLADQQDWKAIVKVIQALQMQQNNDWRKKYFTAEQLAQMEQINTQSYTAEDRARLAEWGKDWSEADQQQATQQWSTVIAELQRLVATHQDPTGGEAQTLAQQWRALITQFTHGDAGIQQGLRQWHTNASKMPAGQAPYTLPYTQEEGAFIQQALDFYNKAQKQD